jgi:hypothetical protein
MRRLLLSVAVVLGLLAIAAELVKTYASRPDGPTYSISQIHRLLAENPRLLVGKTVIVRGTAGGVDRTDSARGPVIALRDPGDQYSLHAPLLLHPEIGHGLIPAMRGIPFLAALVPAAQTVHNTMATYAVSIQAFRAGRCRMDVFSCYYGVLLDANATP